jgi:putative glutamine amidotransferase
MRPIIGITQDIEYKPSGDGFWSYLDRHYAEVVYRFGGMPLMIPIVADSGAAAEFVGRIDGLLLSGGDDIHPRYYGEELSDATSLSPDTRTDYDFALFKAALDTHKPVLGICLGVQTMNVCFGGKLHQDVMGHKGKGADLTHEVRVSPGGRLHKILGADRLTVNSYHHQAIKTVGEPLMASAAAPDGIVEAVELPGHDFVLGVQWHPERMPGDPYARKIFEAFINACRR